MSGTRLLDGLRTFATRERTWRTYAYDAVTDINETESACHHLRGLLCPQALAAIVCICNPTLRLHFGLSGTHCRNCASSYTIRYVRVESATWQRTDVVAPSWVSQREETGCLGAPHN